MPDEALGRSLLSMARNVIAAELGQSASLLPDGAAADHPALAAPGATFVTLSRHGALRGCIGTLDARRSLAADVRANAVAAAFADPRFPRLSAAEWATTSVEVSLLSKPEAVPVESESALLAQLRPGIDGVVLECEGRRATFLPQVWDSLREPVAFLGELKRKAGLPHDFWSPALRVSRYSVTKWREIDFRPVEEVS